MSTIMLHPQNCKSCGYCIRACRQNALFFSEETKANGYHMVDIETEKCIGCGMCYTVCPDYVFSFREVG